MPALTPYHLDTFPPTVERRSLLVVDDDPDTLSLCRRAEIRVVTAGTIEAALELARRTPLSAALVDFHIDQGRPDVVVKRIRAAAGSPKLPILFTSKDGTLQTRVAAAAAGGMRFLDKPIRDDEFAELLHQTPFTEPLAARIVILDDDPIVLEKFESEFEGSHYYVRGVEHPDDLVDALQDVRPDVVLLDINLMGVSGIDICRALRCSPRWQFLPILVFSSDDSADMRVQAYQAGASDFLGKPLSTEELVARVHMQAERIQLIRDRSDRDPLSGLMMRRAFSDSLRRELSRCLRENKPLSLALFDIDHFKSINDRYGHLVGDQVISSFGATLRKRFRLEDLRGRWGGEEFILAFCEEDGDFAKRAAQRILEDFSSETFKTEDGDHFSATCTAGVAQAPRDGVTLEALVKRADDLLYVGKEAGRARVCDDDVLRIHMPEVPPAPE